MIRDAADTVKATITDADITDIDLEDDGHDRGHDDDDDADSKQKEDKRAEELKEEFRQKRESNQRYAIHWRRKKERKKENDDFRFFSKFVFSASIKLSSNQRTCLYSGGSGLSVDIHFVDFRLSFHALSPLYCQNVSTTLT